MINYVFNYLPGVVINTWVWACFDTQTGQFKNQIFAPWDEQREPAVK